jgi:hypothetical protein
MKHRIGKVKFEAPFSRDETIELWEVDKKYYY